MIYIPNTIIEKARYAHIFSRLLTSEGGTTLEALVRMQTAQGMDEAAARENALRCISAVAAREAIFEQACETDAAPMEQLFEKLAEKDSEERLQTLHRIWFGLTIQTDPNFGGTDDNIEARFNSYYATNAGAFSAEEMESRIREALQHYRISPFAMRMLAHKLGKSKGCLATAAALGETGRNLKCLMTMELWLENADTLSMEEAANAACTGADYQAVADAVNKGYIARSVAQKLLKIIGITALIVGAFYLGTYVFSSVVCESAIAEIGAHSAEILANPDLAAAADQLLTDVSYVLPRLPKIRSTGIAATIFGGTVAVLSKAAAGLVGNIAAWIAGLVQPAGDAAPALEVLADTAQEEADLQTDAPVQDEPVILSDAELFEAEEDEEDEEEPVQF